MVWLQNNIRSAIGHWASESSRSSSQSNEFIVFAIHNALNGAHRLQWLDCRHLCLKIDPRPFIRRKGYAEQVGPKVLTTEPFFSSSLYPFSILFALRVRLVDGFLNTNAIVMVFPSTTSPCTRPVNSLFHLFVTNLSVFLYDPKTRSAELKSALRDV